MGFKRQYQLAEKLKTFFPDETSRKSVKILDVAAGTGLVGVGLKKEGSRDQKNISLSHNFTNFRIFCIQDKNIVQFLDLRFKILTSGSVFIN